MGRGAVGFTAVARQQFRGDRHVGVRIESSAADGCDVHALAAAATSSTRTRTGKAMDALRVVSGKS